MYSSTIVNFLLEDIGTLQLFPGGGEICTFVSFISWNVSILCLYHFYFLFLPPKVNFNIKSKSIKTKQSSI